MKTNTDRDIQLIKDDVSILLKATEKISNLDPLQDLRNEITSFLTNKP